MHSNPRPSLSRGVWHVHIPQHIRQAGNKLLVNRLESTSNEVLPFAPLPQHNPALNDT